ncbi:MAG: DEAD/DEAH box helicase [Alphaproteobacteria bacterium]|nr:DEAD/DEAH box helicase [Alphaproteobacteria bacterium]
MTESFEELGLSPELLESIAACGYTKPTPIQAQAIPHILMMRDVVGLAQTGTGKTASFTLPMIEILSGGRAKARMPRSLILSPTRELAAQIAENFDQFGQNSKLTKALLIGGSSMDKQIKIMERGVDVLIATPGRLIDLFERGKILLNDIKILVIDEADRMMDMGFIPDIEKIAGLLPMNRQTLLFSATMPPEIKRLTQKFQSNPREVAVSPPASTAVTVEQFMVKTDRKSKNKVLGKILKQEKVKNAFIFCNRKRDIASLTNWLKKEGYNAGSMHGDMAQSVRTETLEGFKTDKIRFLVCSDVAARGIDVQGTSHVFNYDVPVNPDDYVHRIGRTGRAGEKGSAWMLMTHGEEKQLEAIQKHIGKPIEVKSIGEDKTDDEASKGDVCKSSRPTHYKKKDSQKHNVSKKKPHKEHEDIKGFGDDIPAFLK